METCEWDGCYNAVGPDCRFCEHHEEMLAEGAEEHPPFLSPEADDPKEDEDGN